MNITERHEGTVLVLIPEGRLDHAGAGDFQAYSTKRINEGVRSMVVDFGGTSFLASMGFRALMVPSQEIRKVGGRFAICGLSSQLEKLFEVSGLLKLFEVYSSPAAAAADGVWPPDA